MHRALLQPPSLTFQSAEMVTGLVWIQVGAGPGRRKENGCAYGNDAQRALLVTKLVSAVYEAVHNSCHVPTPEKHPE